MAMVMMMVSMIRAEKCVGAWLPGPRGSGGRSRGMQTPSGHRSAEDGDGMGHIRRIYNLPSSISSNGLPFTSSAPPPPPPPPILPYPFIFLLPLPSIPAPPPPPPEVKQGWGAHNPPSHSWAGCSLGGQGRGGGRGETEGGGRGGGARPYTL